VSTKRRLPVLQTPADDAGPTRPPWQWSVFGAGLIVLVWLVLALLSSPVATWILRENLDAGPADDLTARLAEASPRILARLALENVALQIVVLAVASFTGGWIVGTWGPRKGVVESAWAGALVATAAVLLAVLTGGLAGPEASHVVLGGGCIVIPLAAGSAALGARRGSRNKRVLVGP
jgi:hypothetical protein